MLEGLVAQTREERTKDHVSLQTLDFIFFTLEKKKKKSSDMGGHLQ